MKEKRNISTPPQSMLLLSEKLASVLYTSIRGYYNDYGEWITDEWED